VRAGVQTDRQAGGPSRRLRRPWACEGRGGARGWGRRFWAPRRDPRPERCGRRATADPAQSRWRLRRSAMRRQCVPVDARLDGPARRVSGRYRPAASGDCGRGRGFDAASLQCALAPSIAVSIAFRALQRITGASHPELGGGDRRDFPKQPARPSDRLGPRIASVVRRGNARSACSLDCRSTHPPRRRRCREDDSRSYRQPPAWAWLTPWSRPPATRPGPHSRSRAAPVGAGCAR
jgi:hypothetical protein